MATNEQPEIRVFVLQPYDGRTPFHCVVVTPSDTPGNIVHAAWAYALRYTAKGLDLPDHNAAIAMLRQRHPSWTILESRVQTVSVNLTLADQDEPETT